MKKPCGHEEGYICDCVEVDLADLEKPVDMMIQVFGGDPTKWILGAPQGEDFQNTPGIYLVVIEIKHGGTILDASGRGQGEMKITPIATARHNPKHMTKGQVQAICSMLNYSMYRLGQPDANREQSSTNEDSS